MTVAVPACVTHSQSSCERQSDCAGSGFCSNAGFCESECKVSTDCPCGSFCAEGCNICVRDDLSGPATCFAFNRGLTVAEALGTCRSGFGDAREVSPVCQLDPVTPKDCEIKVHLDAGSASSGGGEDAASSAAADVVLDSSDGAPEATSVDGDGRGGEA